MRTPRALTVAALAAALLSSAACRSTGKPAAPSPLRAIQDVDVAYAGESHDDLAHHDYELRMLQSLTEAGRRDGTPVLLGMEMFQRPFQRHLDDYVAGLVPEREMLRRTEYFDRWRYDHTMYAPLWRWCRANGVRVVALNAERDLVRAASRGGGLQALSPEQRAQLPDEIDLSVAAHRARIMDVFQSGAHPMPEEALQGMYEAMTIWDETMADSAAQALREAGPGARMLVVAGSQHIQEFTGIPDRVTRRLPDSTRAIVVMRTLGHEEAEAEEEEEEPKSDAELGDFVVRLQPVEAPPPSRLGVELQNDPVPEGLLVKEVMEGSNAERAGLLADDVIQWIGGARITDMTDLRYTLDKTPIGATVDVRVLRGGRPVAVSLTFLAPPEPQS